jgi:4-hydroxybenzoate polyprenyltransferase
MKLLRPHQWLKNLLLFFPPFFGGKMMEADVLAVLIPSFLSFSLTASSGYILNDIMDKEADRLHISKKERPIAHGDVSVVIAIIFATFLLVTALIVSSSVSRQFEAYLIIYFFISLLYSLYFKHVAIIDIFFVSSGFLIRVLAGGEAFRVTVSSWLFLTVFVVSLFLAVAKRLGEKTIGSESSLHRKVLAEYPPQFLEGIMWVTSAVSIVMYALYTIENNKNLIYTVPIAFFGFLRFIYIANHDGKGDPTEALLHDPQIAVTGIGWLIAVATVVYR